LKSSSRRPADEAAIIFQRESIAAANSGRRQQRRRRDSDHPDRHHVSTIVDFGHGDYLWTAKTDDALKIEFRHGCSMTTTFSAKPSFDGVSGKSGCVSFQELSD
jgi:hypothetical protein